jgi:hypothetical protein
MTTIKDIAKLESLTRVYSVGPFNVRITLNTQRVAEELPAENLINQNKVFNILEEMRGAPIIAINRRLRNECPEFIVKIVLERFTV